MKKRIISALLAVVLVASMLPVSASAANPIEWVVDGFWEVNKWFAFQAGSGLNKWWENGPAAFWDGLTGGMQDAESDFVNDVNDTIGTTIISPKGYIVPLTPGGPQLSMSSSIELAPRPYPAFSTVVAQVYYDWSGGLQGRPKTLINYPYPDNLYVVPQSSVVRLISDYTPTVKISGSYPVGSDTIWLSVTMTNDGGMFSAGSTVQMNYPNSVMYGYFDDAVLSMSFRAALYVQPVAWSLPNITQTIGGDYSRIGNVEMTVGVTGDNNEVLIAEDIKIVNETNNEYYNPVTDITSVITDWTYDYSNREYSLTLNDETTTTVRFGDDNITINEGGNVYNVYYVVPSDDGGGDDPGTTNPTDPTGPTNPTGPQEPGGDVGGDSVTVDGDSNTGGIFKWFGNITISIGDIIGNILGGGSGSGEEGEEEDSGGGLFGWLWDGLKSIGNAVFGGLLKVIESVLQPIIDFLVGAIDMLADKLSQVIDGVLGIFTRIPDLFAGFGDFLGAFFSFLPPEMQVIMDILVIGVLGMVIVAIIKRFI